MFICVQPVFLVPVKGVGSPGTGAQRTVSHHADAENQNVSSERVGGGSCIRIHAPLETKRGCLIFWSWSYKL